MADRSISISSRKEDVREKNEITAVAVQFELEQINKHYYDSIDDINNQFEVANQLIAAGQIDEARDIWRSQIVFLEGIFDFFIHELSKYAMVKMFTGECPKTASYDHFQIPMNTVEEGLKNPESTSWLFDRLSIRFSAETYLHPEQLGKQLSLIGMKLDDICKKAFPKMKGCNYIKGQDRLKALFNRRNQIAHQADRKHTDAEKEEIDQSYVQDAIAFVTKIVDEIYLEAKAKTI